MIHSAYSASSSFSLSFQRGWTYKIGLLIFSRFVLIYGDIGNLKEEDASLNVRGNNAGRACDMSHATDPTGEDFSGH